MSASPPKDNNSQLISRAGWEWTILQAITIVSPIPGLFGFFSISLNWQPKGAKLLLQNLPDIHRDPDSN